MKNKQIFRTRKELIGVFAHNIVRQSPVVPKNLTEILNYINECLHNWTPQEHDCLQFKDEDILKDVIHMIIFNNPLMTDLNKSQAEKDGLKVAPLYFVSRYSKDDPYHDFVDLDALERNIFVQIVKDYPILSRETGKRSMTKTINLGHLKIFFHTMPDGFTISFFWKQRVAHFDSVL